MRVVATLGQYVASSDASGVQIHQYAPASVSANGVQLRMETDYPWDGRVTLTVKQTPGAAWQLRLRQPAWCTAPTVDGSPAHATDGYIVLDREWQVGERVELDLPMPPRLTRGHPRVESTIGAVAIERGPIVYCLEQVDHPDAEVLDATIDPAAPLQTQWQPDLLGGVTTVVAQGRVAEPPADLYSPFDAARPPTKPVSLTAVPYYAWANRAPGAMRVWIPEGAA
jgi:DUF1680 family protein